MNTLAEKTTALFEKLNYQVEMPLWSEGGVLSVMVKDDIFLSFVAHMTKVAKNVNVVDWGDDEDFIGMNEVQITFL